MAATSFIRSLFSTPSPKYDDFLVGNAAYNPSSFESIATATGTGSSGTITFSSIPSTYQHLQIRYIGRSDAAAVDRTITMRFNSDSGSNYAYHHLYGNGSTVTANGTSTTGVLIRSVTAASAAANVMGVGVIDIHDYASTTKNKTSRILSGLDGNTASTDYQIVLTSGLWINTSAINSITLIPSTGNWTTTSTFALYGIKGA